MEYSCGIIRRGSNRTSWRRMCVGGIWIFFGRVYIVRLVRKVVFTSATSVLLLYGVVLLVYYLFFACVWVLMVHGAMEDTDTRMVDVGQHLVESTSSILFCTPSAHLNKQPLFSLYSQFSLKKIKSMHSQYYY